MKIYKIISITSDGKFKNIDFWRTRWGFNLWDIIIKKNKEFKDKKFSDEKWAIDNIERLY